MGSDLELSWWSPTSLRMHRERWETAYAGLPPALAQEGTSKFYAFILPPPPPFLFSLPNFSLLPVFILLLLVTLCLPQSLSCP